MNAKAQCHKAATKDGQISMTTMALESRRFRWRLKGRETRLLIYLLVLLGVVAWRFIPQVIGHLALFGDVC